MAGQSLVYSNARVKAMENSLLTGEKITRMAYSDSLQEAIKILYESNYGNGYTVDNPYKYAEILRAEENKVVGFLREAMPDKSGLQTFLATNDYHNVKSILKAKYTKGLDVAPMLMPYGNIAIETLQECVQKEDYTSLPEDMASAIKLIEEKQKTGEINPRFVDIVLDKAMYSDILTQCKKAKVKSITKYWITNIDLNNISTFLRCKKIGADIKFFNENFIEGGEIKDYILQGLYKENYDTIAEKLKYNTLGDLICEAVSEMKNSNSLVQFEVNWDNYLLEIFKNDKADVFSVAPIAGFYIAKKVELKMVRMILTCLKNHADLSEIKKRLRGFYA